ncbi:MAG: hypothetical protein M1827_004070 [Pycnora praestabilis]|nr:MAG: hypothetical protein M1827_004070 [Pycnora praestabilis]
MNQRKHRDKLVVGLVEFHKAQCFFILAIQIAAIVVMKAGTLGGANVQAISDDYNILLTLPYGGFIPVTFVLFELHLIGEDSWYLFLLSVCTVGLSAATYWIAQGFDISANIRNIPDTPTLYPGCGQVDPTRYCLERLPSIGLTGFILGRLSAFVFAVVIMIVIFLDQCKFRHLSFIQCMWPSLWIPSKEKEIGTTAPVRSDRKSERSSFFSHVGTFFSHRGGEIALMLLTLGVFILYVIFISVYFIDLASFSKYGFNLISDDWAFGQVVAITVWVPPLLEYLKLELEGTAEGHRYRLPLQWWLVKLPAGWNMGDRKDKELTSDEARSIGAQATDKAPSSEAYILANQSDHTTLDLETTYEEEDVNPHFL